MTFPTTPLLDDFNRGNQAPPGSSWADFAVGWGWDNTLKVIGNQLASNGAVNENCANYWNVSNVSNCEAYFTLATKPTHGHSVFLSIRLVDPTGSDFSRYELVVNKSNFGDSLQIWRDSAGGGSTVLSNITITITDGDSYGIVRSGNDLTSYQKPFGGSWTVIDSITDGSPLSQVAGYFALQFNDSTARVDDFGGTVPTSPPTADFSGTPLAGGAPLSVAFTDTSTGSPTSWLWDFGDSSTSTLQNPTHIYTADGVYTVALTATNIDGSDTETKVGYVTVSSPVADFSGTPTSGTVALSVDFTDLSTNVPTSWFWDFGDGGSSTDQDPTYIYNYIGTYTVTLAATNGSGSDSETKVAYITVTAVVEYGAAVIENCDIDTGGAAVGLRVADVAIARDNRFGSVTVDASAELRAKDNSYTTLVNNGTLQPLAGDRAVFDALNYQARHTNDADVAAGIHHTLGVLANQAAAGDHTHLVSPVALTDSHILVGDASDFAADVAMSGDATMANTGELTLATVNSDVGSFTRTNITVNAKGLITAAANGSGGEVLMADGITPPDPLTLEDETDWLYEG